MSSWSYPQGAHLKNCAREENALTARILFICPNEVLLMIEAGLHVDIDPELQGFQCVLVMSTKVHAGCGRFGSQLGVKDAATQ